MLGINGRDHAGDIIRRNPVGWVVEFGIYGQSESPFSFPVYDAMPRVKHHQIIIDAK